MQQKLLLITHSKFSEVFSYFTKDLQKSEPFVTCLNGTQVPANLAPTPTATHLKIWP